MTCPISMPSGLCNLCPYSKEGLCDYPYLINQSPERTKEITKGQR